MTTVTINYHSLVRTSLLGVFIAVSFVLPLFTFTDKAGAIDSSAAGFSAGNIIDDSTMNASNTMSETQIQNFLKSKNSCNNTDLSPLTWHDASSGYMTGSNGTKYWYNLKNGHFLCMADDTFNGQTAAHIIWQAARTYNINPEVLIVVLQKEQGLVTDTWPNSVQYQSATGYGCPDTAACDSQYYGLANQITWTAKMYHAIETASPTWYTPYILGNNYIQYNPSTSCGGSTVNIQNRATQALYNYTPYQPNAATLNAPMGATVSCGAYGNINFYRYFTQWFGSTHGSVSVSQINIANPPYSDTPTTVSFTVKNSMSSTASLGELVVAVRRPDGSNADFGVTNNISLAPGASYTYSSSRVLGAQNGTPEGTYSFYISRYSQNTWYAATPFSGFGNNNSYTTSATVQKQPTLTSGVTVSPNIAHQGQYSTAGFTINNPSSLPMNLGTLVVAARDKNGQAYDFPVASTGTIAPGASYTYSQGRILPSSVDSLTLWASYQATGYNWQNSIQSGSSGATGNIALNLKNSVTLTAPLTLSETRSYAGDTVTASFQIKNSGTSPIHVGKFVVAVRDSSQKGYDFPVSPDLTLQAGQTYTYSQARNFNTASNYSAFISNYQDSSDWNTSYPESETDSINRATSLAVDNAVQLVSSLTIKQVSSGVYNASFELKNLSSVPVSLGTIVVAGRDKNNDHFDFPAQSIPTINPGQTITYTQNRSLAISGSLKFWVSTNATGVWNDNSPPSNSSSIIRSLDYTIK